MNKSDSAKAIVLLSGGLDSSTVVKIAKDQGYLDLYGLTFSYGQRNTFEKDTATKIALKENFTEHRCIDIDLRQFGGSSLTTEEEVESNRSLSEIGKGIPSTYVPARNTLFLTYALCWAEVIPCYNIFIGANNVDYSGYPDCRPEYFEAFQKLANLATKIGTTHGTNSSIKIHTPLLSLKKKEIIKLGISLGVDYSVTNTCYKPSLHMEACGECDACVLRLDAFKELGLQDPIRYKNR